MGNFYTQKDTVAHESFESAEGENRTQLFPSDLDLALLADGVFLRLLKLSPKGRRRAFDYLRQLQADPKNFQTRPALLVSSSKNDVA